MAVNVSLQTSASVNLDGMDQRAVQRCVTLYVSMVVPVLSQVFASAHMDFMEPGVRMLSAGRLARMVATA